MTTGQLIQQARKKAGLSQKQLGQKLGLSASMIGQWENDLRNPKSKTLQRIATALNVPIYDLMDDYSPIVRELRNGAITLEQLAAELGVPKERILELLNLEIDDPDFLKEVKKVALKLSMQEENVIKLKEYVKKRFAEAEAWKTRLDEIGQDLGKLNDEGQVEAVKRVKELTEIEKYKYKRRPSPLSAGITVYRDGPTGSSSPAHQPPPRDETPGRGTDTTPPPKGAEGPQDGE